MKKIIIVVCALLLGGCSANFAYNNASWLVYWYLDDYIELNNEQEDTFDTMLEGWMIWHRQEELPQYQRQIEDIIGDISSNNINEQTINAHRERARQHWVRIRSYVAPDLVSLGATLSQDQIVYLFASLEKENKEDEDKLNETSELDEQEQIKKWTKRNQNGIKKWLGKLSNKQKEFIASFYDKFEPTGQHWIEYKRNYQQQLREVFARAQRDEMFRQELHKLIVEPEKFRSQTFQTAMDLNAQASSQYMTGLVALMSDKQLKNVIEEINEFKQDIIKLRN
jgi:hypothetical protein